MAKRGDTDQAAPIHIGRKSWWNSSVTTLCGLTFPKDQHTYEGGGLFAPRPTCAACLAAEKGGKR